MNQIASNQSIIDENGKFPTKISSQWFMKISWELHVWDFCMWGNLKKWITTLKWEMLNDKDIYELTAIAKIIRLEWKY